MPLQWNPNTFQYDYVVGGDEDLATRGLLEGQAGTIVGALDPTTQYAMAAESVMPGYADRPYLSRSIGQAYNPLYGQYLTGYGGYREPTSSTLPGRAGIPDEQSFAQWLRNAEQHDPETVAGVTYTPSPTLSGQWGLPGSSGKPGNWADIVNVARSMSEVDPLNQALGGFATTAARDTAVDRWAGMLGDPTQAGALASMATYDPRAGSIFGRLRQEGLGRAQQRYLQGAPGATSADWLGYLTRQNWAGQYKV